MIIPFNWYLPNPTINIITMKLVVLLFALLFSGLSQAQSFANFADSVKNAEKAKFDNDLFTEIQATSDLRVHEIDVDYYKFVYNQRKAIYSWQLLSAKIILAIVIIVVLMGVYLSFLQFKAYARIIEQRIDQRESRGNVTVATVAASAAQPAPNTEEVFSASTVELNKEGIKLNSAVIGLIILIISIAFFFLYLRFVFGINNAMIPIDALNS